MADFAASLKRHWNTTVTITAPTHSQSAFGGASVSFSAVSDTSIRAAIQQTGGSITDEAGRESLRYDATCYIDGNVSVAEGSRVVDGNSNIYTVVAVSNMSGLAVYTRLSLTRNSK